MFSLASYKTLALGALAALLIAAIVAQAQYNTYDSDSNSDSDGNPIITKAELGNLVRKSARAQAAASQRQQYGNSGRNLYNRQQPMQYAPSHNNRRNSYGSSADSLYGLSGGPSGFGGLASNSRGLNANADSDDDGDSAAMGPNFNANFDSANNNDDSDGEPQANLNLNQAASGYPGSQGESGDSVDFGFGGASNYGPSSDVGDFGPSEGFGNEGRRAKSASAPMGARGFGVAGNAGDEDAGAPLYGPNSAVNSGDVDDEGRAGYSPEGQADGDNDDE